MRKLIMVITLVFLPLQALAESGNFQKLDEMVKLEREISDINTKINHLNNEIFVDQQGISLTGYVEVPYFSCNCPPKAICKPCPGNNDFLISEKPKGEPQINVIVNGSISFAGSHLESRFVKAEKDKLTAEITKTVGNEVQKKTINFVTGKKYKIFVDDKRRLLNAEQLN